MMHQDVLDYKKKHVRKRRIVLAQLFSDNRGKQACITCNYGNVVVLVDMFGLVLAPFFQPTLFIQLLTCYG